MCNEYPEIVKKYTKVFQMENIPIKTTGISARQSVTKPWSRTEPTFLKDEFEICSRVVQKSSTVGYQLSFVIVVLTEQWHRREKSAVSFIQAQKRMSPETK